MVRDIADVVNLDYLDGTVVEDAVKEGIIVYEHNDNSEELCVNVGV